MDKYKYLTSQDLGYKQGVVEQAKFEYSPLGKVFNCEVNLILTWSKNCLIKSKATRDADPDADPAVAAVNNTTNATFKITDTKLYLPVVTL